MNWKKLITSLAVPLAVGGLSALVSGGMSLYGQLVLPPFSPPGWVFPIVWTVLYLLMGYAAYRITTAAEDPVKIRRALTTYALQLAVNFLWSPVFFGLQWYLGALVLLIVLWVLILRTVRQFSHIDDTAGSLLLPYILWVTFALYLNFGVYLLN